MRMGLTLTFVGLMAVLTLMLSDLASTLSELLGPVGWVAGLVLFAILVTSLYNRKKVGLIGATVASVLFAIAVLSDYPSKLAELLLWAGVGIYMACWVFGPWMFGGRGKQT